MRKVSPILGFCLAAVLLPLSFPGEAHANPRVVLDAAHGGSDSGVKAGSQVEKDWNLKVCQALEKALEAEGIGVVQVRQGDTTIPQEKRTETINTSGASAAIVVHADREWTGTQSQPLLVVEPPNWTGQAGPQISRWGVITPAQYRTSLKLARDVARQLGLGTGLSPLSDSRGLAGESASADGRILCLPHQSLRNLVVPAVVLTPLFLTSSSDLQKFSNAGYLSDFAARVAKGVANFLQGSP